MLLNKLNLPAASRVASLRRRVIGVAALLVILAGSDFESRADCFGGPSRSFVQVVSSGDHSCGLTAEGAAYCWGYDGSGQLGDGGGSTSSQSPVAVDTSSIVGEKAFVMLAAGGSHTCGLTAEGTAYCWGHDGLLGNGGGAPHDCGGIPCAQSPVLVDTSAIAGEKSFVMLSAGNYHTCGLTSYFPQKK